MYAASINDPETFWGAKGKRLDWMQPYTKVKNTTFDHAKVSIKWYEDGILNVSANCIDRHLSTRGEQVAIVWEGDDPNDSKNVLLEINKQSKKDRPDYEKAALRSLSISPPVDSKVRKLLSAARAFSYKTTREKSKKGQRIQSIITIR